ncbi:hypothetical protein NKG94_03600 [Micromonospora sp. M12]
MSADSADVRPAATVAFGPRRPYRIAHWPAEEFMMALGMCAVSM